MRTGESPPSWMEPALGETLRALVRTPASSALAREHWKYTRVEKITELLDSSTVVLGCELEGDAQAGVTIVRDVLPDAHELNLLSTRSTYCPATAKVLLNVHGIDRLVIGQNLAEPLVILRSDVHRPLLVTILPGVSASIHDLSSSATGWLIIEQQPDSHLDFTRLHTRAANTRWHQLQLVLNRHASLTMQHYCTGATFSRQDIFVALVGAGSSIDVQGCWSANARDHLDQQWHVEHHAPHTRSSQVQHGIADGRAVTTYRGRIFIGKNCPAVDASLMNRNLTLCATAVCNTKPELEINTDDVRCSHGATVGQLSEESIFYFQSRGVDRESARKMLAAGFINQCLRGALADSARLEMLGTSSE